MRRLSWSLLVYTCLIVTAMALLSAPGAQAAPVYATSYDMLNGQYGEYAYVDSIYPSANNLTELAPLTGGLGYLTDGKFNTQHWYQVGGVGYLGWYSIDPEITFNFAGTVNINQVGIHVDNTPGSGDVRYPASAVITMGAVTDTFSISPSSTWGTSVMSHEKLS